MSEKPFWEGKTCNEMAGLHVKVTFESGTVVTGVTDINGNIDEVDVLSPGDGSDGFLPCNYVESIELVDDSEYERIDNIEDVHAGDEVFTLSGNKYKARVVYESMEVYADGDGFSPIIQRKYFAYALRRKPQLPDHDGLWLDKDGSTWMMRDGSMQLTCSGADDWCFTRPWFSLDSVQVLNAAPFRPAKVVEA